MFNNKTLVEEPVENNVHMFTCRSLVIVFVKSN